MTTRLPAIIPKCWRERYHPGGSDRLWQARHQAALDAMWVKPGVDKKTMDLPALLTSDADGKCPIPLPGITTKREY